MLPDRHDDCEIVPSLRRRGTILAFVRHYAPGYRHGGPIRALCNLVDRLGDEYAFRIVTSDRDAGDTRPYEDVTQDQWVQVGKANVLYLTLPRQTLGNIRRLMEETPHDLIYLNSLFDRGFTMKPLLAREASSQLSRPVLIAPRGELAPSALRLKGIRKAAFLQGLRLSGHARRVGWQASTAFEARDIEAALGKSGLQVAVAPDVIALPDSGSLPPITTRRRGERFRVGFFSRISPVKNLEFAISVVGHIGEPIEFEINGVVSDQSYWDSCKVMLANLPGHIASRYRGAYAPDEAQDRLSEVDLFFLPTQGESFGHVIFEALLGGLPVVISDRTPWRDLKEKGVGTDLPLSDRNAFVEAITGFARMDPDEFCARRESIRRYAIATAADDAGLNANRRMFDDAIRNGHD